MAAARDEKPDKEGSAGVPADAYGNPAVDPSENVKALNEAANKRQDDLRAANNALFNAKLDCANQTLLLLAEHAKELSRAESRRVDEQAALRADFQNTLSEKESDHFERLAEKESARIDAIRAVDVLAVQTAAERASAQASVLATQVSRTEETLRSLVATTAQTVATQLQQITTSIDLRLVQLERAGNQAVGRQTFADPQLVDLLAEVKTLRDVGASRTGRDQGISMSWAVLIGLLSIAGIIAGFLGFNKPSAPISYAPPPAVSYAAPTVVSPAVVPVQPK